MSRFPICAHSWAITPSSSNLSNFLIMPRVRAIDASRGVRPVANAFDESSSMIYTCGVGKPAASAIFSTLWKTSRYCVSVSCISCAPTAANIIESPNAHDMPIHIKHPTSVGTATVTVVLIASFIGTTHQVNKNTSAININGNSATKMVVFILFWRIWSYTVFVRDIKSLSHMLLWNISQIMSWKIFYILL